MSASLLEKLSAYCDQLVGESPVEEFVKQKKKKKRKIEENEESTVSCDTSTSMGSGKKKLKKTVKEDCETTDTYLAKENSYTVNQNLSLISDGEYNEKTVNIVVEDDDNSAGIRESQTRSNLVTDDGFKIVSSIPEDDSDVSDAFESDIDEDDWTTPVRKGSKAIKLSSSAGKTTEDGFKIISQIPLDDSDVSDAFTDEEEDYNSTGEDLLVKRKKISSAKGVSKPLLEMINDFGLDGDILKSKNHAVETGEVAKNASPEKIYAVRKSKKKKKKSKGPCNTSTLAARTKPQVDVTVYDYTSKRGLSEKTLPGEINENSLATMSKEDIEKHIKSMRFDIYKFGMTGFGKKKKKQTRAALAIKLGAVPRKKTGMLYKNLLVLKKKAKEKEKKERELNKEMGIENKKKGKKAPTVKKKQRSYSSQVGRFKDGVLSLSKKDLAKIKKSR